MNAEFFKQAVASLIRHALPIAAIAAALSITEDEATRVIIGAAGFAIAYIWSLFNKSKYEEKVEVALDLPATADRAKLEDVIAKR